MYLLTQVRITGRQRRAFSPVEMRPLERNRVDGRPPPWPKTLRLAACDPVAPLDPRGSAFVGAAPRVLKIRSCAAFEGTG
jgi:hypothetical protein